MMRKLAIVALLLAGASSGAAVAKAPAYSASIVRTSYGIPHITANNWRGIGYGVGYAYAQDNLCMLAEEFATVAGERSLHFGPTESAVLGFEKIGNLASDTFFRGAMDLPKLRRGITTQGPESRQVIAGYVAGYNRLLRELGPAGVPAECRGKAWVHPITTDDMLRLTEKQVLLASSLALAGAVVNAAPPGATQAADQSVTLPDQDKVGIGSNGWAFGGDVTENGRGVLVGNPHFPWNGPARFWEMHLTIPGVYDVMGVGIAGTPIVSLGFNKDIGWTHTVTAAQHFTLFELELDPADPTRYLVDGKSEKDDCQDCQHPDAGRGCADDAHAVFQPFRANGRRARIVAELGQDQGVFHARCQCRQPARAGRVDRHRQGEIGGGHQGGGIIDAGHPVGEHDRGRPDGQRAACRCDCRAQCIRRQGKGLRDAGVRLARWPCRAARRQAIRL